MPILEWKQIDGEDFDILVYNLIGDTPMTIKEIAAKIAVFPDDERLKQRVYVAILRAKSDLSVTFTDTEPEYVFRPGTEGHELFKDGIGIDFLIAIIKSKMEEKGR